MKSYTLVSLLLILIPKIVLSQAIGLNTTSPLHPVHVKQPVGTTLAGQQPVMFIEYTGSNLQDVIGIKARSKPADYYGVGGDFEGGFVGLQGRITAGEDNTYYGVRGDVAGSGAGNFYSLYGYAHSSGNNYGVYGTATGGVKNWAGYFAGGNVYIQNRLGIANSFPAHALHVNQTSGAVLTDFEPVAYVEYTGTNHDLVVAVRGKSVPQPGAGIGGLFEGGQFGTYGYIPPEAGSGDFHYAVFGNAVANQGTNIGVYGTANGTGTVNYAGYFEDGNVYIAQKLGVGRSPVTNKLEVEGNASKSSAGDWLANSDERLKKNIKQLDASEMIEKLLALKGVTYEWNDDKTGTTRPVGRQYGFSAQNIQAVFPELVEEDANGYLQTAYSTYDAMIIEALRFLYQENQELRAMIEDQN